LYLQGSVQVIGIFLQLVPDPMKLSCWGGLSKNPPPQFQISDCLLPNWSRCLGSWGGCYRTVRRSSLTGGRMLLGAASRVFSLNFQLSSLCSWLKMWSLFL
jgi:hypothetical protein